MKSGRRIVLFSAVLGVLLCSQANALTKIDNNTYQLTDKKDISALPFKGKESEVLKSLLEKAFSVQQELVQQKEISEIYPITISYVHGIKTKKDLDIIEPGMSTQKTQTFEELT